MPTRLLASQQLTATGENLAYVVGGFTEVTITSAALCNVSGSAVVVGVSIVPNGATAGATNKLLFQYSLPAGDTVDLRDYLVGLSLGVGDSIWVNTATANAVNVIMSAVVR